MTADAEMAELRKMVHELTLQVAELVVTVKSVVGTVASLPSAMVTREAHDALRETVQRNDDDCRERDEESKARDAVLEKTIETQVIALQKGIDRNDARWAKLAWFIGLAVAAAVLGLVLYTGGVKP